ncbi:hypothetical protein ACFX2J_019752 [Malus domestica]
MTPPKPSGHVFNGASPTTLSSTPSPCVTNCLIFPTDIALLLTIFSMLNLLLINSLLSAVPVDLEDFITVVLRGLGSDYLTLTTAIINVTILLTFEELTSKIEAFDLQNLRTSTTSAAL